MSKKILFSILLLILATSSLAVPLAYAHALDYGHGNVYTSSNLAEENSMYIVAFNPPKERRLYVTGINITFPAGFDVSGAEVSTVFGLPTRGATVTYNPADNSIIYDFGRRYRLRYGRLAMMFITNVTNLSGQGNYNVDIQLLKYGGGTYDIIEDALVFIRYVNGSMIQDGSIEGVDINPTTSLTVGDLTVNGPTTTENLAVTDTVDSDLIPSGNYGLGASGNEWANLYAGNGYFSNQVQVGSTVTITTDTISGDNNLTIKPGSSHDLVLQAYNTGTSQYVDALRLANGNPPLIEAGVSIDMNHNSISDVSTVYTDNIYLDYMYANHYGKIYAQYPIVPYPNPVSYTHLTLPTKA